jgi:hypothetical protein
MTTTKSYSRREFLKTAAMGALAAGVVGYLGGVRLGEITCSKCGGTFSDGHAHAEGPVAGVYCPNCGVELSRLEFDVDRNLRSMYPGGVSKRKKQGAKWDVAQIPFPNRKLVGKTDKPAVTFSEVNFEGRRTI